MDTSAEDGTLPEGAIEKVWSVDLSDPRGLEELGRAVANHESGSIAFERRGNEVKFSAQLF